MHSDPTLRQILADFREIQRADAEMVRRQRAERIAARFEIMNRAAQAREARRQMHISAGLGLGALIIFLAIFHDAPARTAATVLDAEAVAGDW